MSSVSHTAFLLMFALSLLINALASCLTPLGKGLQYVSATILIQSFGGRLCVLKPPAFSGLINLLSQLLRNLSKVAGSKPTFSLSLFVNPLLHLEHFYGLNF